MTTNGLTEVQKAAIARAEAKIAPALELYETRNKIFHMVGLLPLQDLRELAKLLTSMTKDELRMAAAYCQGLVEWRKAVEESQDADSSGTGPDPRDGPGT